MELEKMIIGLRKPLKANNFESVIKVDDYSNDILLSYFLENHPKISINELTELFKTPKSFYEALQEIKFSGFRTKVPEDIKRHYNDLGISLSTYIKTKTDYFSWECEDQIILGKEKAEEYTYPNGEKTNYSMITDEVSANFPISTAAFCLSDPKAIFVRQNSLKFMKAYAQAVKSSFFTSVPLVVDQRDSLLLEKEVLGGEPPGRLKALPSDGSEETAPSDRRGRACHRSVIGDGRFPIDNKFLERSEINSEYHNQVLGILISHEKLEAGYLSDPDFERRPLLQRELMVEEESLKRLLKRGISLENYLIFHKLRTAGTGSSPTNISWNILQNSQFLC